MDLLERRREVGLSEAARETGVPKATVYRLLSTLADNGLLARTSDRRYRLGLRLLHLGTQVADSLEVRRLAIPTMKWLRDRTGQSTQLVIRDGTEGVYVERVEGTTPVRLYLAVGRRAPLYAGASTRLLLAFCSPERRAAILAEAPPQPHTPNTVTDPVQLRLLLEETRLQGWTVSLGELQPGTAEMAAPIFDHRGKIEAALSIAGPDNLYQPEHVRGYLPLLMQAAAEISRGLGYRASDCEALPSRTMNDVREGTDRDRSRGSQL